MSAAERANATGFDQPPRRRRLRFVLLIIVHVAATVLLSLGVNPPVRYELLIYTFLSFIFAQGALVGVWAGMSVTSKARRMAGASAAGIFLWVVLIIAMRRWADAEDVVILGCVVAACLGPAIAVFVALKHWGPRLAIVHLADLPREHRPPQFGMKHLLLLASLVAVALTVGKAVRETHKSYDTLWLFVTVFCAVMAVLFLHMVLTAAWAGLAADRVRLRVLAALAVSMLIGLVPPFYFNAPSYREWIYCPACGGLAQLITILSLAVARSAGYRIVAMRTNGVRAEAAAERQTSHPLD